MNEQSNTTPVAPQSPAPAVVVNVQPPADKPVDTAPATAPAPQQAPKPASKAPAKSAAPKASPAQKAAAGKAKVAATGRKVVTYGMADKIQLSAELKGTNPKKRTAAERFAFYKDSRTVGDYVKKVKHWGGNEKLAMRDLAWDTKQGWVKVIA